MSSHTCLGSYIRSPIGEYKTKSFATRHAPTDDVVFLLYIFLFLSTGYYIKIAINCICNDVKIYFLKDEGKMFCLYSSTICTYIIICSYGLKNCRPSKGITTYLKYRPVLGIQCHLVKTDAILVSTASV